MHIHRFRALKDNYVFLLADDVGDAVVVDPSEAAPVIGQVERLGVRLRAIWNTHHHHDHVGGNAELVARYGPLEVVGAASDRGRIPAQNRFLADGDQMAFAGRTVVAWAIPGHTTGHMAYLIDDAVFPGDTLFGAGCGRLFEGTPAQMRAALERLRALPDRTRVFCGHEYTRHNLRFAVDVELDNPQLRARLARVEAAPDEPTVPLDLGEEKATNPFLRWDQPGVKAATGEADPVAVFAAVRRRKDVWRE